MLIYADEQLAVVHKPAGLPTHASRGFGSGPSVLSWLRQRLGRWMFPVHRLDAPVSGVLVMALSPAVAKQLAAQFRDRTPDKSYTALCRGWLADAGVIDKPLRKITESGESAEKQEAVTTYRTLQRLTLPMAVRPFPEARYSLVELQPLTGRTHQLRRHMASLSHPLIGDTRYGDGAHNRAFRQHLDCHRLLLHARRLRLLCPLTGKPLVFTADFGDIWRAIVAIENHSLLD